MATSAAPPPPVRNWVSDSASAASPRSVERENALHGMNTMATKTMAATVSHASVRAQDRRVAVGLRPVTQQQLEGRRYQRASSAPVMHRSARSTQRPPAVEDTRNVFSGQTRQDEEEEGEWKYVESRGRWHRTQKRMVAGSTTTTTKTVIATVLAIVPNADGASSSSSSSWSTTSTSSSSSSSSSKLSPVFQEDFSRKKVAPRGRVERCAQNKTTRDGVRSPPSVAILASDLSFPRSTSLQKLLEKMELEGQEGAPQKQQQSRQQQLSYRKRNDQGASSAEQVGASERWASMEPAVNLAPPTKKCGDKRDFFFRNLDFETRSQLQIDDVAGFSVTEHEMAARISEAILALFAPVSANGLVNPVLPDQELRQKYPLTITDATACIGGNVISFCDYFTCVNAVECDLTRCQMLQHNLSVLKKENATCIHASYLVVMHYLRQDVVFMDPPWGGPEYKDLAKVDLFLDGIPLYEICTMLFGRVKVVVLKVPTNFDTEKFAQHVPGKVTVRKDLNKMHLVTIDFREE